MYQTGTNAQGAEPGNSRGGRPKAQDTFGVFIYFNNIPRSFLDNSLSIDKDNLCFTGILLSDSPPYLLQCQGWHLYSRLFLTQSLSLIVQGRNCEQTGGMNAEPGRDRKNRYRHL